MADTKPVLKPCPFCGHVGLDFAEGSTFRWIVASCGGCGATTGETRIQTLGQGTRDEWMTEARSDAIAAWNRRASQASAQPADHTAVMREELDEDQIEAIAHRTAWRYRKSSDPHHSDTYTFNRHTLMDFAHRLATLAGAAAPSGDTK